jgi:hypothetical protein
MSIKLAIKCQFIFKHSLPLNCFANNLKYKVKLFREDTDIKSIYWQIVRKIYSR